MTNKKKSQIKKLAVQMLKESFEQAKKNSNPMLIPKAIVVAILNDESEQYDVSGTSFEKQMKKDIKEIGLYL